MHSSSCASRRQKYNFAPVAREAALAGQACVQIVALFAMERPVSLGAEDVRNEKVKLLRSMQARPASCL